MTTGAFWPGPIGRPVSTTVSPLNTDLTVANPWLGSTVRIGLATGTGAGADTTDAAEIDIVDDWWLMIDVLFLC